IRNRAEAERDFARWQAELLSDDPVGPGVFGRELPAPVAWDASWRRRCLSARRLRRAPDDLRARVEALRDLAAPGYVIALTGADVPDRGGMIRCPMPDHDDRTPSCQVFPDERGWVCHGCHAGGRAIELAAAVWGLEP